MNPDNGDDSDNPFGPVIFKYTRAMAIQDGTLVDLNAIAPDVCRRCFKYPIAMTAAAFAIVERAVANKETGNDLNGVLYDIFYMTIRTGKEIDQTTRLVEVIITGAGPTDLYTFKVVCGPGDDAEPVLTIMLPDED